MIPNGMTPKLQAHITSQEWSYFKGAWGKHKSYFCLTLERDKVNNLWECLLEELVWAATDDGFKDGSVVTKAVFLNQIKKLAVKKQNTLVAQVQFLNMGQDRGKAINSYVSKPCEAAIECKFWLPNPCDFQIRMN